MGFSNWLQVNEQGMKRFESFVSIVASFSAIVGVIIALFLLYLTKKDISTTAKNIRAGTIYSIARDGRELNIKLTKKEVGVGAVHNYLHSVWHQKRLGILDERVWSPIENEICAFLRDTPDARSYWDKETRSFFDSDFVAWIEEIQNRPECKPNKGGTP